MKDGEKQKTLTNNNDICSYINITFPTEMTCPVCGHEVELWTDEDETKCYICGYKIFQKEKTIH